MGKKRTVDIVIPIYNEEAELEANAVKLHSFLERYMADYQWHITIADNASTDTSLAIAKRLAKQYPRISVLHLDQKGRGRAVKLAWIDSHADIVSYMDIDLSTELSSFPKLLAALARGAEIAIGSRLLPGSKVVGRTPKREILSRVYNILIRFMFGTRFTDAQCGFKAATRNVVRELIPVIADNAWFFDSELLIIAQKSGYHIHEEPVVWIDNPGSTVRVLGTVKGDLLGLWRLFTTRPWRRIRESRIRN